MGNSLVYVGVWEYGKKYKKNNIVVDPTDKILYACDKEVSSYENPSNDHGTWTIFFSHEWIDSSNPVSNTKSSFEMSFFYGIFTTSDCCCRYDHDKRLSIYDASVCPHQHQQFGQEVARFAKVHIHKLTSLNIPINLVGKQIGDCFEYNPEIASVNIKNSGMYRFTYNVCYHGSIYDFKCIVAKSDGTDNIDAFTNSHNKSTNRHIYDKTSDKYYENVSSKEHLEDITQYINHTFIAYINVNSSNKINLLLNFTKRNIGKIIFLHPVETWINIEKISDGIL